MNKAIISPHIKPSILLASLLLTSLMVQAQWGWLKGNGDVRSERRSVRGIEAIEVNGSFDVFVKQGNQEELIVEADENLLDIISTEVNSDGTLLIKTKKSIRNAEKLNVFVTVRSLRAVHVSGAADLEAEGWFQTRDLLIASSGSANIKFPRLEAETVECRSSGSSDIYLAGSTGLLEASMSGSCDLKAAELEAYDCELNLSGSSDARVHASRSLVVNASGSSDVYCSGNPRSRNVQSSGSSDVHFR